MGLVSDEWAWPFHKGSYLRGIRLLAANETKREQWRLELQSRRLRWPSKPLHEQYIKTPSKVDDAAIWASLKHDELKKQA